MQMRGLGGVMKYYNINEADWPTLKMRSAYHI